MKALPKYSMGIGDRFGRQGEAQLAAMVKARELGVIVAPVWNKSHREHTLIGTKPQSVRDEADAAVRALGWRDPYFVDADHIGIKNVDLFVAASDFFTLDVADFTGTAAPEAELAAFVSNCRPYLRALRIDGLSAPLEPTEATALAAARKYLLAVKEAGRIYRRIREKRGNDDFATEVSMDETNAPQTPAELLFILAAIAQEGIPAQTVAPKFSGRFNKGVDYVGDARAFAAEFADDLAVIRFAVREFGLPANLKLSVHSGSDKFSLYPLIRRAIRHCEAGLHLKTAGTTWLEEIAGLAQAGGDGLAFAKDVYARGLERREELCGPYATVLDIDPGKLPPATAVARWSAEEFAGAVRHDPGSPRFNPHVRQLMHVAYKVAAEAGTSYLDLLDRFRGTVAAGVTGNVFERHLRPLFVGAGP